MNKQYDIQAKFSSLNNQCQMCHIVLKSRTKSLYK